MKRLEVPDEHGLRFARILVRMHAQTELGARVRQDRVDRAIDRQDVDPGYRHGRPGPDALAEAARPEERHARLDLRQLAELLVTVGRAGPLLAQEAGDRDIALLVVE